MAETYAQRQHSVTVGTWMGMQKTMSWVPGQAAKTQRITICWGQNEEVTFYGVTVKNVDLILPTSYLLWEQLQQSRRPIPVQVPTKKPDALFKPGDFKTF